MTMDYFQAVQVGKQRVQAAVDFLGSVAGPCYPMLFLKLGLTDWTPVGEEMLYSMVPGKGEDSAIVICDSEGNSKAMTPMMPSSRATIYSQTLENKSIKKFEGEVRLPI